MGEMPTLALTLTPMVAAAAAVMPPDAGYCVRANSIPTYTQARLRVMVRVRLGRVKVRAGVRVRKPKARPQHPDLPQLHTPPTACVCPNNYPTEP